MEGIGVEYGRIAGVERPVSRIFLGTANIPQNTDANAWLSSILETGVNALDTARAYGDAETVIGRWFAQCGTRDKVVLLSKCCHPFLTVRRVNVRAMKKDLARSLEALQTDHIDVYLLHRDDPQIPVGEVVEAFNELRAAGYIRAFGGSNWAAARLEAANEYAYKRGLTPFAVSSPSFGLAAGCPWRDCLSISGRSGEAERDWYRETRLPVLAFSALGRGLFSGRVRSSDRATARKYMDGAARRGYATPDNFERLRRCEELAEAKGATVPQVALAWSFRQGLELFAVINTSNAKRMEDNAAALSLELTERECRYLDLLEDRP